MTVADLLNRWLTDYAEERVTGRTLQRYEGTIRNHLVPAFGALALEDLQPAAIQAYYRRTQRTGGPGGGPLSPATVLQHHSILRCALARAVRWGLLDANPADRADPPRVPAHCIRVLDESETRNLLRALQGRSVYTPTLVAVGTGMRRGEILALRWSEVDLARGELAVVRSLEQTRHGLVFKAPKTRRSRRRITLPDFVVRGLRDHREHPVSPRCPAFAFTICVTGTRVSYCAWVCTRRWSRSDWATPRSGSPSTPTATCCPGCRPRRRPGSTGFWGRTCLSRGRQRAAAMRPSSHPICCQSAETGHAHICGSKVRPSRPK
jgi:integrase